MPGSSGPSPQQQVADQQSLMINALQSSYQAQADATTKAAQIASDTADKNRQVYIDTNTSNQDLLKSINLDTQNFLHQTSSQIQSNLAPYMQAGNAASGQLQSLLGLNGYQQQKAVTDQYLSSPVVQDAMQLGVKAIDSSQAAAGMSNSGRTLQQLFSSGQQVASQGLNTYANQLLGLVSTGANAVGNSNAALGNLANTYASTNNAYGGQATGLNQNTAQNISAQNTYAGDAQANASLQLGSLQSQNILGQAQVNMDAQKQLAQIQQQEGQGLLETLGIGLGGSALSGLGAAGLAMLV